MIGSLMSRMGTAENLSIPQLKQAIQDGTLPAYVGIPLLQEKIKQQQPSGNVTTQPPIAQQVMQQAAGVEQLPSNLPTEMAADGGIMHFASGDLVPDDEEDQADEDEYQQYQQMINPQGMDEYSLGPAIMAASQYKNIGAQPYPEKTVEKEVQKYSVSGTHPYEKMALEKAKELGVSPDLVKHIIYKETGNLKDPAHARSSVGAQGVMQLMPGTAKDLGVKDPFDPAQNIHGGVSYLSSLMGKYHDPKLAAAAYNWGPGNVDKWLKSGSNPNAMPGETRKYIAGLADGGIASIPRFDGEDGSVVEEKYTPEELSKLKEFKQSNSGIGSFFRDTLPNYLYGKTIPGMGANAVNYIRNNADFSGVRNPFTESVADQAKAFRSYSAMDKNKDVTGQPTIGAPSTQQSHTTDFYDMIGPQGDVNAHDPMNRKTWVDDTVYKKPNAATPETTSATTSSTKSTPTNNATSESTGISALPSNQDQSADYFSLLKQNMADTAKEKENDKYMALLAAGLGMMSGTSPYAAANIGQGALAGVKQASEDQKLRAQQQAQYLKDYGTGVRYQQLNENARLQLAQSAKQFAESLGYKWADLTETQRHNLETNLLGRDRLTLEEGLKNDAANEKKREFNISRVDNMRKNAASEALAELKLNSFQLQQMTPSQIEALTAPIVNKKLNNQGYRDLHKQAYGYDPFENSAAPVDKSKLKPLDSFQR